MGPNVGALIYFLERVFLISYFDIYPLVTLFMSWLDSKPSMPSRRCKGSILFQVVRSIVAVSWTEVILW